MSCLAFVPSLRTETPESPPAALPRRDPVPRCRAHAIGSGTRARRDTSSSSASTEGAAAAQSWVFSSIGSHSRCSCVATPSSPFSISYPWTASPLPGASERIVPQTEWVCNTAPAPRARTIARWRLASAEGRPEPATTPPCWSISRMSPGERVPLSTPLEVMARRRGSRLSTALKFPLVPMHPAAAIELPPDLGELARQFRTAHR